FFEDVAQLGNDRVRRSVNNPPIGDLLFEGRTPARALRPPDREFDKLAAMLGREIARWGRPYRMRETGELALHPQELGGRSFLPFLRCRRHGPAADSRGSRDRRNSRSPPPPGRRSSKCFWWLRLRC